MEHRWGERSKLNIPVQVDCGSRGVVLGVMRDASASGAFLCTAAQLSLLTSVRVDLGGAPALGSQGGVDAQVIRRATDGYGLEWSELAPEAIVNLLNAPRVTATPSPSRIEGTVEFGQSLPGAPSPPAAPSHNVEETTLE